ncbi:DUF1007 family protein [Larsenimonas suaedae]|uniref:DUF1007 family protein n=1 Tax=Larsenimonas suaedae TaxID=1851019 RepID=A0ABU1GXW5_9GAMM|nr:DUF1007 family protein [Larsenimonas suaedae]MCM2972796.1 DUF1007 family protein [Larsenimonas suaedae]MDR5896895.1 DUF1007 family protein [Larsenimonas suaedae]
MKRVSSLKRACWRAALAACVWGAFPLAAAAHPHGWVDISVEGVFDAQGRLTALNQHWRMDPLYSQVLMEDIQREAGAASLEARLDALGVEIRDNLARQHNLTQMRLEGRDVAQAPVTEMTTRYRDRRLVFRFTLPLAAPLSLAGRTFRYQVFDPTYYIEMLHEANEQGTEPLPSALQLRGAPKGCTTTIIEASPDPKKVAEAAMLDRTQQGEPDLGRFFTETGEISCPG